MVDAVQEFQFVPKPDDATVFWSEVRDDQARFSRLPQACIDATMKSAQPPVYPRDAIARQEAGMVLTKLTFTGPDTPPEVKILFEPRSQSLVNAVQSAVARYRMPCADAGAAPISATQTFDFKIEGAAKYSLQRDLTLVQFAGLIDDLKSQKVRFDFTTMGCPFDVKLKVYRPYMDNRVGELADRNPGRREFLEWLRKTDLQIPTRAMKDVLGSEMIVSVPCMVLDLT